jgi:hypothetical protein
LILATSSSNSLPCGGFLVNGVGRMRTMCGSRTGGWSLPCVMSD